MCIIFVAYQVHQQFPLIIAANRDEFISRPTQAMHWWKDAPHIYAGRDRIAGGSWMGYSKSGRIAAITNLRRPDLYQRNRKSRGTIVKRFLDLETTQQTLENFTDFLTLESQQYNPFNLLFGDTQKLYTYNSIENIVQPLTSGIHSISNGDLHDIWPKMQRGVDILQNLLHSHTLLTEQQLQQHLFTLLQDHKQAPTSLLPHTGITQHLEKQLSSIFIPTISVKDEDYGTRSSSLLWNKAGTSQIQLIEKSHNKEYILSA